MQHIRVSETCQRVACALVRDFARKRKGLLFVLALSALAAGCAQVGSHEQRLVSKSNMTFSDSLVFGYQNKILPQVEPGSAFSGGAQSSGCTSCK